MKDQRKSNNGGTSARITPTHALLAGTLLAVVVMPLAFASASNPTATTSASAKKQIKSLKKRVSALEGKTSPATLPPSGPAGGDLTGTYPAPLIGDAKVTTTKLADNAVTTNKLTDNAVTTQKIADNAITSPKILNGQVRAGDLGALSIRTRTENVAAGGSSSVTATSCNAGEVALSGGGQWTVALPANVGIQTLAPVGSTSWLIRGRNQTGGALDLTTYVVCLQA